MTSVQEDADQERQRRHWPVATEAANRFSADFAATMTVDGEPLRANGPVTGGFVGNRVRTSALPATKGLVGAGAGAGTLDGKPAVIGLEFYADVK